MLYVSIAIRTSMKARILIWDDVKINDPRASAVDYPIFRWESINLETSWNHKT